MSSDLMLKTLQRALRLPQATLAETWLAKEQMRLLLLDIDAQQQLNTEQITFFWQQLPFWAFAWAGGRALVQWLNVHPQAVAGKRVLDFGCGSAMVAIAAAKAGAKEVWVADLDPNALVAAQYNAQLNQVEIKVVTAAQWPEVDVLLASDVLYDISSSEDLRLLMLRTPQWILAESQFVKPDFVALERLERYSCSTLPKIGDFDDHLAIEIYGRTPCVY